MVMCIELDDHGILRGRDDVSDDRKELGGLQDALPELGCLPTLGLERICELVPAVVPCNQLEREFRRLVLSDAEREPAFVRLRRRHGVRNGA